MPKFTLTSAIAAAKTIYRDITAPPAIRPRSVLPMPVQKVKKTAPRKEESTMYDIDVKYNERGNPVSGQFGFYSQSKEADREGAVRYCTEYDKQALRERGLMGGKKVQAQNEKAKAAWFSGDSVSDCEKIMHLSASWVEKRYAAFGAALLSEKGELAI